MRHRRAVMLLLLAAARSAGAAEDAPRDAVVTSNPLATDAALGALHAGGSAADAAVAAQMVLAVVEPQSSGLGGGSVLLHYDVATREVTSWDGREAAPGGAMPGPLPVSGGRAVGVPGTLAMLDRLHREHGALPWADLLAPAIRAAEEGAPVSPALAAAIRADADRLGRQPAARALYFGADDAPLPAGAALANPALAQTLRAVAAGGAAALMHGPVAADIAIAVRGDPEPGLMTTDDLAAYAARRDPPACAPYRGRTVCAAAPPAAGFQVLESLGLLELSDLAALPPDSAAAAQRLVAAERLASADRAQYLADPAFVPSPLASLLGHDALAARAQSPEPDHAAPAAPPEHGSALVAVVDAKGNAAVLCSSLGGPFGAGLPVRGFLLNAALAAFTPSPSSSPGDASPPANGLQPGKRPATSLTPAFLLDADGRLQAVLGSTGGDLIPDILVQAVAGLVDWGLDPAQALALPHVAGVAGGAVVETAAQAAALQGWGPVTREAMPSMAAAITLHPALAAAADRRGEAVAAGD